MINNSRGSGALTHQTSLENPNEAENQEAKKLICTRAERRPTEIAESD